MIKYLILQEKNMLRTEFINDNFFLFGFCIEFLCILYLQIKLNLMN